MTGITKKTETNIQIIENGISNGLKLREIGVLLHMTRAGVSDLVCRYLPKLRKEFRMLPKKETIKKSDLEKIQRDRFKNKKANSKRTGYEWNLEFEDIYWPTHCPILGLELDYFAPTRQENSPSFDRFDSSKGYVKNNTQVISWRANRIKNDGTAEEHRQIADYMATIPLLVK